MVTITKINSISHDIKKNYKSNEEIVLLPLSKYSHLLEELEELKDIKDHIDAMKDYRIGKGKKLREFLNKHKHEFKLQDRLSK